MKLLKETLEFRAETEEEAKNLIEQYREEAREKGYTIGSAGFKYKTKKNKQEVLETWVVTVTQIFGDVWGDD